MENYIQINKVVCGLSSDDISSYVNETIELIGYYT